MTLSQYLEDKGLSHAEFAKSIGVSQVTVTRWANGQRFPGRREIERIQKATKGAVTANDLLRGAA